MLKNPYQLPSDTQIFLDEISYGDASKYEELPNPLLIPMRSITKNVEIIEIALDNSMRSPKFTFAGSLTIFKEHHTNGDEILYLEVGDYTLKTFWGRLTYSSLQLVMEDLYGSKQRTA